MAKRKRLEPARFETGNTDDSAVSENLQTFIETKLIFPDYANEVTPARRSPIAEVAENAATTAALQDLTHSLTTARNEGRLIQRLPLSEIDEAYLVRDRIALNPQEMDALRESLRQRGQQTAIEVADLGAGRLGGRWGLISGWRRLKALQQLQTQTGQADTILAIVRTPREAADAYLSMIEENEIRAGLSYYERARIVARAADQGVYPNDRVGLSALFSSASRSKRSKIGSFLRIVRVLDDHLRFPAALNERLGLALSSALETKPGLAADLMAALSEAVPDTATQELRLIQQILRPDAACALPHVVDQYVPPPTCPATEVIFEDDNRLVLSGPIVADPRFQNALREWVSTYEMSCQDG